MHTVWFYFIIIAIAFAIVVVVAVDVAVVVAALHFIKTLGLVLHFSPLSPKNKFLFFIVRLQWQEKESKCVKSVCVRMCEREREEQETKAPTYFFFGGGIITTTNVL